MSSISFRVGSLGWMPPCLHKLVATQAWTYWHGRVQSASHTQFILRTGKKDEPVRQSALSTKSRRHEVDCWGGQCFWSSFGGGRQQESGGEVTLLGLPSPVRRPPASAPLAPLYLIHYEHSAGTLLRQPVSQMPLPPVHAAWVPISLALESYSSLSRLYILGIAAPYKQFLHQSELRAPHGGSKSPPQQKFLHTEEVAFSDWDQRELSPWEGRCQRW